MLLTIFYIFTTNVIITMINYERRRRLLPRSANIMPRLNDVLMSGLVAEIPEVKYDENNTPVVAAVEIVIIHGERDYGDNVIQKDVRVRDISHYGTGSVWVVTNDPVQIEAIRKCQPYDIVMLKGCLRIKDIKKRAYCPDCQQMLIYRSRKTSIYPIYFERIKSVAEEFGIKSFITQRVSEQVENEIRRVAFQELRNRIEISNTIHLIGVVCEEPLVYRKEDDGKVMMTFPFAVKRRYFIPEDDMKTNVDFPYIKLYGNKAKEQVGKLTKGNLIMLDGFVNTRTFNRKLTCEHCESVFLTQDYTSDVVAYSIEYLRKNISDVENTEDENDLAGIVAQSIGSEADTDLKQRSAEEIVEERIMSGYKPDDTDTEMQELLKSVEEMNET